MTECSELRFAFATEGRREMVAEFNGGAISSDGGALLLRETDRKLKLLERFSQSARISLERGRGTSSLAGSGRFGEAASVSCSARWQLGGSEHFRARTASCGTVAP
jgi:Transposase DDE domain group 1